MKPRMTPDSQREGEGEDGQAAGEAGKPKLHPDILRLGLVSFLTDLSSELIFSVFAIFFTTVAGASSALLGLVEGLADLSASSLNYLAGRLSDGNGKRKVFTLAGYAFSTVAKLILLVSTSIVSLSLFRVLERLGKGFRGPPRDAWLSAIADSGRRGYSFGVHKALDKSGAVAGPLLAYAILSSLGENAASYRLLFAVALLPAVISIIVLACMRDQPAAPRQREDIFHNWRQLDPRFKRFLLPAGLFALAYFSLGFLLLKAHDAGFSTAQIVLLYALFNVTCVLAAPLAGWISDRVPRHLVVVLGYLSYALVTLYFIFAHSRGAIVALFALYGLFYAIEESQSRALIADLETERRASAFGIYNFVTGALYLPASLIAGTLWTLSPDYALGLAAALALAAAALMLAWWPRHRPPA